MDQQPSTDEVIARAALGKRHAEDLSRRMLKLAEGEQVVTVLRACEMVALNALMSTPEGLRQANLGQFIYALCGDILINAQQQAEKSPGTEATGRSAEEVVQRTQNA